MCNNQAFPSQVFPKPCRSLRAHILFFFFLLIFPLCFFSSNVQAGEVTLAWDPPSVEYGGFVLSYGTSSGSYSENQDVGTKTTYTVTNLDAGQTYFFAVKAYSTDKNVESSYSNQVNVALPTPDTTAPTSPKSVQIVSGG
jgi:hypothetical protein